MTKREFMQIIDKYYFNYDLREIRITIWTGQASSFKYFDSWISVDAYNEDGDFISEIDDYLIEMYCDIPTIKDVDNSTLEDRKKLMAEQQKLTIKLRKWLENYDIIVRKTHANV